MAAARTVGIPLLAVWVMVAALCACRRPGPGALSQGDGREPAGASATRGASIVGTVRFIGDRIPSPTVVPVGTDIEACGTSQSKRDVVIDSASRAIRNVIVWLERPGLTAGREVRPGRLVLDNRDCQFVPHAAVVTVGSKLEIRNRDAVLHTAHAYFAETFNLALPTMAPAVVRTLNASGIVMISCDRHGWMSAYLRVDPHPYHAVSDAQGRFTIEGVPSGSYQLKAWHETLGAQERSLSLVADEVKLVELSYPPRRNEK